VSTPTTFKRVPVCGIFVSVKKGTAGKRFRKVSGSFAHGFNPNGTGRTHERVKFSKSHAVTI